MMRRNRILVGLAILGLGAGTLWLAATQSQDDVRYVEQVLARPDAHRTGVYTLMGVPEPAQIPYTGPNGTVLAANPEFGNETRGTVRWREAGQTYYSTHILRVTAEPDGAIHWNFRNETRRFPSDPQTVAPPLVKSWIYGQAGEAFPVVGFSTDGKVHADTPRIWAFYGKAPEHPMQPKPSQFTGRLLSTLPDGTAIPDGALVYEVAQFTAGCSSKFLPPEARAEYEKEYGASPAPPAV